MAVEFYIPKMSDHMEEAVFTEWLVAEGDPVEKGQPVLVIETDKVTAEVEAPASGFLKNIRPGLAEGVSISVGETVAFIVNDPDEEVPLLDPLASSAGQESVEEDAESTGPSVSQEQPDASAPFAERGDGPVRATPAARKAGRELGIDLAGVAGSGPGGRVSESDVRKLAAAGTGSEVEPGEKEWLDLTPVQKVTARRMTESNASAPQFSLVRHFDMTPVLAARASVGADSESKPSVTAYLVKAIASALSEHPRVNGFFRDQRIEINRDINVGVAIGTDDGLFVPVIRNADRLSVTEIAENLIRLRGLAVDQAFAPGDLEGGTFTLSNLGMFGIDEFAAIVNPPQSAILAAGRVAKAAVVDDDGDIRIRDRMTVTMTADHRSLDGLSAALFLSSVAAGLEEPDKDRGVL